MFQAAIRRLACLYEYLFRRRRLEDDLDEELRSSFDMLVDQHVARGMSAAEARRVTRLEFEGLEQVKESTRRPHRVHISGISPGRAPRDPRAATASRVRRDLAGRWRSASASTPPSSASFYGVLLHPLPYGHPERLVRIWGSFKEVGAARAPVSGTILGEIERRNRSLSGIAGIWSGTATFTGDDPEQPKTAQVTTNFFDVLGVRAAHGRTFTKDDAGGPLVILSDGFFRCRFASNLEMARKGVSMQNRRNATLPGVLPADFQLHFAPDANLPVDTQVFFPFANQNANTGLYMRMVARIKPGVSEA